MKTTFGLLLVMLLGIGLGVCVANLRVKMAPWSLDAEKQVEESDQASSAPQQPAAPVPKLVVAATRYDFGNMDIAANGTHDFVLSNDGDAPLKLTAGATSCRCTMSKLEQEEIPPGGTTKVTLTWKSAGKPGPYEQTAEVRTSDPQQPRVILTVSGRITAAIQLIPSELIFSRMSSGEAATGQTELIYYLTEPLTIARHEWLDSRTAQFFDVATKPMAVEELKDHPEARSGLLVTVTVKPGLPQGSFRQRLVFHTNVRSSPTLTLPIEGTIASDIAIVGRDWDADTGILSLGTVPRLSGAQCRLMLVVRGPLRKEVQFKTIQSVPNVLKVSIGKMREINQGAVMETPLVIEVPPGAPPVSHLGSEQSPMGEILLESTHPQVPKLRISVRFAIEG